MTRQADTKDTTRLYAMLEAASSRPEPYSAYTTAALWTDTHTSKRMLECHLQADVDISSRKASFIEASVAWMTSRFGIGPDTSIADFGCGPGLYAARLARLGARVTGIDFSPRSLEYARTQAAGEQLAIDYVCTDYLEYETQQRFDLIVMLMYDLCALSPDQRQAMLVKFRRLLAPGGKILLDVYSLAALAAREEETEYAIDLLDGFWASGRYHGFRHTFRYDAQQVVCDKYTIIEENKIRNIYNWLQYFSPESLTRECEAAGLIRESLLGDVAGTAYDPKAPEFAVVLGKP